MLYLQDWILGARAEVGCRRHSRREHCPGSSTHQVCTDARLTGSMACPCCCMCNACHIGALCIYRRAYSPRTPVIDTLLHMLPPELTSDCDGSTAHKVSECPAATIFSLLASVWIICWRKSRLMENMLLLVVQGHDIRF